MELKVVASDGLNLSADEAKYNINNINLYNFKTFITIIEEEFLQKN